LCLLFTEDHDLCAAWLLSTETANASWLQGCRGCRLGRHFLDCFGILSSMVAMVGSTYLTLTVVKL